VVQAALVYLQALQAHQFTMLVAEAVVVGDILLEVAVVLVAVVKAVMHFQLKLDQHYQGQLTLAVAVAVVIIML